MFPVRRRRFRRGYSLLDATAGVMLLVWVSLIFAASYPTAHRAARMTGDYSQATSVVQHKVDQLRAVGYGRLTGTELRNAGIIDPPVSGQPWRFEGVDGLATDLWNPVGTITLSAFSASTYRVTVRLEWQRSSSGQRSNHEVETLIANE
jgi:hypothetical protein